jgi:CDP-glycerol glycerophosphotransferase (TagB/SpsB family)
VRPIFDYDVVPYLFISDLLISDISSVVNEFTLLDRPMVLIDVPRLISNYQRIEQKRGLETCDLAEWGQSAGELVKDMADLPSIITGCLEHPEKKQEIRREFAEKFFFNPGHATDRAVAKIYELLKLPQQ